MPRTDVSDALFDPDFADRLECERIVQTIGDDGIARGKPTLIPFLGVVTSGEGSLLERMPHGERVVGSIVVHTAFRLVAGTDEDALTADTVTFNGRRFTVAAVDDYSHYGRGFTAARCDPKKLRG